jgi:hypothetical protein
MDNITVTFSTSDGSAQGLFTRAGIAVCVCKHTLPRSTHIHRFNIVFYLILQLDLPVTTLQ